MRTVVNNQNQVILQKTGKRTMSSHNISDCIHICVAISCTTEQVTPLNTEIPIFTLPSKNYS